MKWFLPTMAALSMAMLIIMTVVAGVNLVAVAVCAVPGFALGVACSAGAVDRDKRLRALVRTALGSDANVVNVKMLASVLGTRDVVQAHQAAVSRREAMLAQRYANGDASDY